MCMASFCSHMYLSDRLVQRGRDRRERPVQPRRVVQQAGPPEPCHRRLHQSAAGEYQSDVEQCAPQASRFHSLHTALSLLLVTPASLANIRFARAAGPEPRPGGLLESRVLQRARAADEGHRGLQSGAHDGQDGDQVQHEEQSFAVEAAFNYWQPQVAHGAATRQYEGRR